MLEKYVELYGEIVFPGDPQVSKVKEEIFSMPGKWMASNDGIHWRNTTSSFERDKIRWVTAFFRKTPEGVIVGVNEEVKKTPGAYLYSNDNGYSWIELKDYCPWLFHGEHELLWFKRKDAFSAEELERARGNGRRFA